MSDTIDLMGLLFIVGLFCVIIGIAIGDNKSRGNTKKDVEVTFKDKTKKTIKCDRVVSLDRKYIFKSYNKGNLVEKIVIPLESINIIKIKEVRDVPNSLNTKH